MKNFACIRTLIIAWVLAFLQVFTGKFDTYHLAMGTFSFMVHIAIKQLEHSGASCDALPEWATNLAFRHIERIPDSYKIILGMETNNSHE